MRRGEWWLDQGLLVLYRFLLYPLLRLLFQVLSFFSEKVRLGLELRKKTAQGMPLWLQAPQGLSPIWIHCASGEFEYAKPILELIRKELPQTKTMVTYFSPTFQKSIANDPRVDFHAPLPWDQRAIVQEFLRHHNPRLLLVARTDLWPEVLRASRKSRVPILLFAATLSPDSVKMNSLISRTFLKWRLSYLTEIFCVSALDQRAFQSLNLSVPIQVEGDTRYDQVISRLEHPRAVKVELQPKPHEGRFVFVCGSTWAEDEEKLWEVLPALQAAGVDLVVVPHEPSRPHIQSLQNILAAKAKSCTLYSEAQTWPKGSVLLVDQVGILAEIYRWGNLALVGGSFRKSVHSVMEPLAAGLPVIVGPHYQNNREAQEFMTLNPLFVRSVSTSEDLLKSVLEYQKIGTPELGDSIRKAVKLRSGGSQKVLSWIRRHLA